MILEKVENKSDIFQQSRFARDHIEKKMSRIQKVEEMYNTEKIDKRWKNGQRKKMKKKNELTIK